MSVSSKFVVMMWMRHGERFDALWRELLSIARHEPESATEYEGMVDVRWGFDDRDEAERHVATLKILTGRPDVAYLNLTDYTSPRKSMTYKDARFAGH